MTRRVTVVCLATALLATVLACSKKETATPSAPAVNALPPDAKVYLQANVRNILDSAVVRPLRAKMDEAIPAACRPLLDSVRTLTIAGYGEGADAVFFMPRRRDGPPPHAVVVLEGPTAAEIRACLDAATAAAAAAVARATAASGEDGAEVAEVVVEAVPPPENRDGREIRWANPESAVFSVSDTVHVMATAPMLDAALAAAAGGPSLEGGSVLQTFSRVPNNAMTLGIELPEEPMRELMGGLALLLGGDVPPPSLVAVSVGFGDDLAVTGAIVMGDDGSAQALESTASAALTAAKMAGRLAMSAEERAVYGPVLDSIRVARDGKTVSASVRLPLARIEEMFVTTREERGHGTGPEPGPEPEPEPGPEPAAL